MLKINIPSIKVFVVILIAVVFAVAEKRFAIYPYEVDRNYEYLFDNANATVTHLALRGGKFTLPERDDVNRSTFLELNVNTTFMGEYLQPGVEVGIGDSTITQYFEHGAKGIRYINISSLPYGGGEKVSLDGKYTSINDQSVRLIDFKNPDIKNLKIFVLAPHPDDAEIAAYGLYSDNKNSYIVTVSAGDAGEYKYDEIYENKVQHYLKKGEIRTWNSIAVPLLGGVKPEQAINLGFFDGTIRRMFKNKARPVSAVFTNSSDINTYRKMNVSSLSAGLSGGADWNSLVENLRYLLLAIKPDLIVTPYPLLDSHDDHKFSSVALFEAIKKADIRAGHLYLYSNHFSLNDYFPYGKEGGAISLPPNFGSEIYFDSVYSHPLSLYKQKEKVFALEAMNDLRLDTEWRFFKGSVKNLLRNSKNIILGEENSYYKRSIRSNELFFVVDIINIYDEDVLSSLIGEL
ncbi:PIG-L family deacetylase [uncultured Microbulbifer sp.]|uniref:PIG-L deacetylase family protein n=1 Tax=uncultured Microbulbifer sp. TaxID=348147 RepID=UPI002607A1CB|nr:PIG-L family deacetylase [uncultured Microbulbifer sp.]